MNKVISILSILSLLLVAFQNCSDVAFFENDPSTVEKVGDDLNGDLGDGDLDVDGGGEPGPDLPDVVADDGHIMLDYDDLEEYACNGHHDDDDSDHDSDEHGDDDDHDDYDDDDDHDSDVYSQHRPLKIYVCHFPPGNPEALHTICIGAPALQAHLHHGPDDEGAIHDVLGRCEDLF